MPKSSSNSTSVTIVGGSTGAKKGSGINVGLTLNATEGSGADVNVGMSTSASSTGSGKNQFSLSSTSKSGKIDKLGVKVAVGDWAREPGDQDDLDFLICVSGAKGGKLPAVSAKKLRDIDLRFDIDLQGLPLNAVFRRADVDDLKLVKCVGQDGQPGWGYVGTLDDLKVLTLALRSPESGEKVAELAIKLDVDASDDHGF